MADAFETLAPHHKSGKASGPRQAGGIPGRHGLELGLELQRLARSVDMRLDLEIELMVQRARRLLIRW